ncbi:hypothetical protein [Sphingomonas sp.]|uniref:hypothetical protein n=1 Tax=Sphingomonas sp. TaxID=28214 RepID=UPI003CC55CF0
MQPRFEFSVDVARSLVLTRLSGFFDDAAIRGYLLARKAVFARLRCGPYQHLSLTDIRDMAIQTQEVVQRWGQVLADPMYRSKRLAFVTASTLARMQLQRAIGSRDAQVFTDMDEAERWLFDDAGQADAA